MAQKWIEDISVANTFRDVAKRIETNEPEKARELHRQAAEFYIGASKEMTGYQKRVTLELADKEAKLATLGNIKR